MRRVIQYPVPHRTSGAQVILQCVRNSLLETQPPPFSPRRLPLCLCQLWARGRQVRRRILPQIQVAFTYIPRFAHTLGFRYSSRLAKGTHSPFIQVA